MSSLSHATVADAMHEGVVYCEVDAPLSEVARQMPRCRPLDIAGALARGD